MKTLTALTTIILTLSVQLAADATPGRVRASSLITCKNGVTYGAHGDGHYHVVTIKDGKAYATGQPVQLPKNCK